MNKQEYIDYFGDIITIQEALDRFYEVARQLKQIFRSGNETYKKAEKENKSK